MKKAIVLAIIPFTQALVGLSWSVSNTPSSGLKDITFPFSIANAPHETGYYFAQQFNFNGLSDVGYAGLQPRPDASGSSIVHAVFSSFVAGTTSTDQNCSDGADGGAGVSCSVEIPAPYAPLYHLVVKNTGSTTWTGTLVDTVSGKSTHVGSYTLPNGAGGIISSQVGFIEYYPWNAMTSHSCSELPYTNVTFGAPTTSTPGAGAGQLNKPYEYGDCVGKVNFDVQETDQGYQVSVGF
ncbi:uncharacterized protein CDV56_101402 [Aspergillus thermomutatus]|uniref:Ubiquitin 3 binding protein But2 C-terminal domain-containing protein n=1 Tax=Aspergillus thermomutatus TaxID=41047 RepID=A0A397G5I5_ASPTH|nr:uncharacterized protein CDV56_101402 [Aspergillus thermomutatus]RHZ45309.1 hypothetical protein CDV56_101402 [Aspergillus thermomutatus]